MSNELFKQATQNKYRFESTKGLLTVEDLWDLSLTALDNVAVTLDEQIQKASRPGNLLNKTTRFGNG